MFNKKLTPFFSYEIFHPFSSDNTNMNEYRLTYGSDIDLPWKKTLKIYYQYKIDTRSKYIPSFKELEEFRIKRYLTNGNERFDEHVDVTDFDSSIRAVAFIFYLNGNDGNTLFPLHNLNIKPVSGRVIVFPPTWEYPHLGLPPKSNSKYIMSTYVHYG